jgi:hypothetical protein
MGMVLRILPRSNRSAVSGVGPTCTERRTNYAGERFAVVERVNRTGIRIIAKANAKGIMRKRSIDVS